MLEIVCFKCKQPLTQLGALLFSPPDREGKDHRLDRVYKAHLCVPCYKRTMEWIATDVDDPAKYKDTPVR